MNTAAESYGISITNLLSWEKTWNNTSLIWTYIHPVIKILLLEILGERVTAHVVWRIVTKLVQLLIAQHLSLIVWAKTHVFFTSHAVFIHVVTELLWLFFFALEYELQMIDKFLSI